MRVTPKTYKKEDMSLKETGLRAQTMMHVLNSIVNIIEEAYMTI